MRPLPLFVSPIPVAYETSVAVHQILEKFLLDVRRYHRGLFSCWDSASPVTRDLLFDELQLLQQTKQKKNNEKLYIFVCKQAYLSTKRLIFNLRTEITVFWIASQKGKLTKLLFLKAVRLQMDKRDRHR